MAGCVVAFEATLDEIVFVCADGERFTAELPHGVLLPPRPTEAQYVAAMAEWVERGC